MCMSDCELTTVRCFLLRERVVACAACGGWEMMGASKAGGPLEQDHEKQVLEQEQRQEQEQACKRFHLL